MDLQRGESAPAQIGQRVQMQLEAISKDRTNRTQELRNRSAREHQQPTYNKVQYKSRENEPQIWHIMDYSAKEGIHDYYNLGRSLVVTSSAAAMRCSGNYFTSFFFGSLCIFSSRWTPESTTWSTAKVFLGVN